MAFVEASFYSRVGTAAAPTTPLSATAAGDVGRGSVCSLRRHDFACPQSMHQSDGRSVMFLLGVRSRHGHVWHGHEWFTTHIASLTNDVGLAALRRRLAKASKGVFPPSVAPLRLVEETAECPTCEDPARLIETFTDRFLR